MWAEKQVRKIKRGKGREGMGGTGLRLRSTRSAECTRLLWREVSARTCVGGPGLAHWATCPWDTS